LFALAFLFALRALPGAATAGAATAGAASAAADVDHYLAGLSSWSADFKQTISDGHGKELRSAAGKFSLERPGKFRWDYSEPSEQLILADGKQIWFYDKDLAQANVRDMDSTLASTPAMLLSGTGSVSAEFDIKALPNDGGLRWFQLVPKHPNGDFQLVRIGFDKDGELSHVPGGQARPDHAAVVHPSDQESQVRPRPVHVRAAGGSGCDRTQREVTTR